MEYQQEFYTGKAEDLGKVIAINQTLSVPAGSFSGCIVTEDWSALDPTAARENKTYCPRIGHVLEIGVGKNERIELISRTP